MPVFTIETPTGQKLDIEADDEAAALNGAQQWHSENAGKSTPVTGSGLGAAALGGLGKGTAMIAGLPGDIGTLANVGANKALEFFGGNPIPVQPNTFGSEAMQKRLETLTGPLHQPQNTAEKYVETAASFVPGAIAAPGGMAANAIRYGIVPGLASEAAGQLAGNSVYEPYARAAAGIGAGLVNPSRLVTPLPVNDARMAAINALKKEGVTSLTAGQKTGNLGLRNLEEAVSSAPFAGNRAAQIQDEGQAQFTEAALRKAGASGAATPEILLANQKRLGQAFEDLSARNTLIPDNQFITDLTNAVSKYRNVPDSQQRAIVQGYINDIIPHINAAQMPGTAYQPMRSILSRESKSVAGHDPYLSQALGGIKESLDSAMARSISPEDAAAWAQVRKEYGAQEVLKKAASRAGEATAEGQITPPNLRNVVSAENRGAYALGKGTFSDLARSGAHVMTPLPNSGTAQKLNAYRILDSLMFGAPQAVAGRTLMSPLVQGLLGNQVLRKEIPKSAAAQKALMIQALQRASVGNESQ